MLVLLGLVLNSLSFTHSTFAVESQPATSSASTQESALPNWYPALGVGVPHPLSLSVVWNASPEWTYTAGVGFLYLPFGADRTVFYGSAQVAAHWHPFFDAFYVGVEGGYQSASLKNVFPSSLGGASLSSSAQLVLQNIYVCPVIGAEWKWKNGWRLIAEAGWQLPLWATGSVADSGTSLDQSSQRAFSALASTPLPSVAIRVGKTF